MSGQMEPLELVYDEDLRLRQVTAFVERRPLSVALRSLLLTFDDLAVAFVPDAGDALTIVNGAGREPPPDTVPVSLNGHGPWSRALGKPLLWAWSMTNQQGYRDGCQLEFAEDVTDVSVIVQLIVVSATICVRAVDERFTPPPDPDSTR